MSKGNLFLGFGRGKVGDVVFSRLDGQQVARAYNSSPKNPRSGLQLLQRSIMKTSSSAYSLLRDICDHSFQGFATGSPNQSRFLQVNVAKLRERCAALINDPSEDSILSSQLVNFSSRSSMLPPINTYQVSEGTIPPLVISWTTGSPSVTALSSVGYSASYAEFCAAMGVSVGDQLTFLWLSCDDTDENGLTGYYNGFRFARVIMSPSDGDTSKRFLTDDGAVNDPNPRNEGSVRFAVQVLSQKTYVSFSDPASGSTGSENALCACAAIISRQSGGIWQRSAQSLVVRPTVESGAADGLITDPWVLYLGDAVQSWTSESSSLLYLNQGVRASNGGALSIGAPTFSPLGGTYEVQPDETLTVTVTPTAGTRIALYVDARREAIDVRPSVAEIISAASGTYYTEAHEVVVRNFARISAVAFSDDGSTISATSPNSGVSSEFYALEEVQP